MSDFIKKLVEAEKTDNLTNGDTDDEDMPIEYYEIKELAKRRVLLKNSIRIHAFIFVIISFVLFASNILTINPGINSIFELWAVWPTIFWGLGLFLHYLIVISDKIVNLRTKIYLITSGCIAYLIFLLIIVNNLTLPFMEEEIHWSQWTSLGLGIIFGINTYINFYHGNTDKFENSIEKEIEAMKHEYLSEIEKLDKILAKNRKKEEKKGNKSKKWKIFRWEW